MPATSVLKRLFTVKEYHLMADAGVFANGERVELIRGGIIKMASIGRRHAACVDRCNYSFARKLGTKVIIRIQNPLALDNTSEPDVMLRYSNAKLIFMSRDILNLLTHCC